MDHSADRELLADLCRWGTPPLPSSAMRLALDLARDEGLNDEVLVEHVESDARLRFGLLIGANLPLFGAGCDVKTVGQALARLGRRNCLSLLWLLALSDLMGSWRGLHDRARNRLWRHSLMTAVVTRRILRLGQVDRIGEGFAAGMAHDVGHLLMASPAARLGIVWHQEHDQLVEREISPAPERDHCQLGAALLRIWDAPDELVSAALHHHEPAAASDTVRPIVEAVRMADLLAEHIDCEHPPRPLHLESASIWLELTSGEPWNGVPYLAHLAIELLPESLLLAEHLANVLGA